MQGGFFLTVEGIDGAGKGTQLIRIEKWLQQKQLDYIALREPGGTRIGEAIRAILLDKENIKMDDLTELLLFQAARAQLIEEVIRPALAADKVVLCDRFFDSTWAYQAGGRGLDPEMVEAAIALATRGLSPQLTIYLDLEPALARERLGRRASLEQDEADRIEEENLNFSVRVRQAYLDLARREKRIRIIDADRDENSVWQEIENVLEATFTL
jgi:dTMP kinase